METTYLTPGVMTGLGRHALPAGDLRDFVRVLQGLFIHEGWAERYGVTLTDADRETAHLRPAHELLDAVLRRDGRPFDVPREPGARVVTNCRGYTVLLVAMLRAHGVPARARAGFGTYFQEGFFEDHWVAEYHDGDRWRMADAQIDSLQREVLGIEFDLLDLPAGAFVPGPDAWRILRAGADPSSFGLIGGDLRGAWFVAGDLLRDLAAVGGVETLPWDSWDPMPGPSDEVDLSLFDRYAAGLEEVKVPNEVFNVLHGRLESLTSRP